jgi:wyosine [tRNA(Phe)-imidazoG37] synthetase (radical SAM superfamily)
VAKLTSREHDFGAKLCQASVIERLKAYVDWKRNAAPGSLPDFAPLSINLDLTSACNFACPHCVDSGIINTGEYLTYNDIQHSLETLKERGLLSVILIGGGEPTLHRDFEDIVCMVKRIGLQVGIVTNGTRLDKVAAVADRFEEKDWLRLSIDAGHRETFIKAHRPKVSIDLHTILQNAHDIKKANPAVSLGYSFVIVWDGIEVGGIELAPNIDEMESAVQLALQYGFDYVSFKPCLVRLEDSKRESLLNETAEDRTNRLIAELRQNLDRAERAAQGRVAILKSVNLQALLESKVDQLKKQPRTCHMQFFRTVMTPVGIYHCPAFRGIDKACIADPLGYVDEQHFANTAACLEKSLIAFEADSECSEVACFYHHVNWWVDQLVSGSRSIDDIEPLEDDNFFF